MNFQNFLLIKLGSVSAIMSQLYLLELESSVTLMSGAYSLTSKSLKAVLLHNGSKLPSIPLAHSAHLKEDYSSMHLLIEALKYGQYGWEVIGDFKMIALLMGLQGGFIKFQCYLCLWDSRDTKNHCHKRKWPPWIDFTTGQSNIK